MNSKKVVLITGASSGIGRAVAAYLHEKGCKVYGTSRAPGRLNPLPEYEMLQMDVTVDASVNTAVQTLLEKEGRIDVLVNNAGVAMSAAAEDVSLEAGKQLFEINVFGLLRVTKAVLPAMRKRKTGMILNISSLNGLMGLPFVSLYSASKFAVEGITESLSLEVKHFGIKVCAIEPGYFQSQLAANQIVTEVNQDSPYWERFLKFIKMQKAYLTKAPSPDPVAKLVYHVIHSRNPKLRYTVGNPLQRWAPGIMRILPRNLGEALVLKHYKL